MAVRVTPCFNASASIFAMTGISSRTVIALRSVFMAVCTYHDMAHTLRRQVFVNVLRTSGIHLGGLVSSSILPVYQQVQIRLALPAIPGRDLSHPSLVPIPEFHQFHSCGLCVFLNFPQYAREALATLAFLCPRVVWVSCAWTPCFWVAGSKLCSHFHSSIFDVLIIRQQIKKATHSANYLCNV